MMEIVSLKRWEKYDLTPCLWKELPNDIQMSILARLSLPQLFQACLICKEWNSFISSHKFLSIYNDNVFKHYYPIIKAKPLDFVPRLSSSKQRQLISKLFYGYNQRQGQWEKLPTLKFFPYQAYKLVDAIEGLLCFRGASNVFVYNLLVQTYTQLPPITDEWNMKTNSISILEDCNTNSYQIIMVGWIYKSTILHRGFAIYKSTTRTWKTSNVIHPLQLDKLGLKMRFDNAIVLKDALYCEIMNSIPMDSPLQIGLMIYNMQAKVWHDSIYIVPSNNQSYSFWQVVQCGGDIYMVLIPNIIFNYQGCFKSIQVFKLESNTKYTLFTNEYSKIHKVKDTWKYIASEDIQDLRIACDDCITTYNVVCIGHRTQIYLSIGIHYIVYNVESNCWNRLPRCLPGSFIHRQYYS